jgi:hypothetical protein
VSDINEIIQKRNNALYYASELKEGLKELSESIYNCDNEAILSKKGEKAEIAIKLAYLAGLIEDEICRMEKPIYW